VDRLAPSRPNGVDHGGSTECDEETAKPVTNASRLGLRRPSQSVKTDRAGIGETANPVHGVMCRDLDEGVPVAQYFEKRDLDRPEPLIPALGAGRTAHEVDSAGISRYPPGHGDHLPAADLG
jgi:hypothetical protein